MTNHNSDSVIARVERIDDIHKRARRALIENLSSDEPVLVVLRGINGQAIVGTDRRVFVLKPGAVSGAAFGIETTSWTYSQVTGIQLHTDVNGAVVLIQGPGQSGMKTSRMSGKDDAPIKAPNAIVVRRPMRSPRKGLDVIKSGVAELRTLVEAAHARGSDGNAHGAAKSLDGISAEIARLGELHRSGVLTDEEFSAAKAGLLSMN